MQAFPRSLTSFVGRKRELGEIATQLADPGCRLLTLVGPGGVGKTRLAAETAAQVAGLFPDGLWFVSLQAVDSPDRLIPTIRGSLAIAPSRHIDPLQAVSQRLQGQSALLVLDNLEHLLDGAGSLVTLLQQTESVKLLVTSRERLNLDGEWRYEVEGLDVPSSSGPLVSAREDAVQLFIERARQARHGFVPEPEADEIVRICRLVNGMPLAIELAARWLGAMDCAAVAREIELHLDFLASDQRDLPERHRQMRVVIDHSWQQLSAQEQDACMRLSVFRGGFQRGGAETVAGAALHELSGLVHKSLLHWDPQQHRYQMHELLRQYAAEMLANSPDIERATRNAHCSYFAHLLHDRFDLILGNWRREAIPEIEAQIDNIRLAWSWAIRQGKTHEIRMMAIPLCELFQINGRYAESVAILDQAIAHGGELQRDDESILAHLLTRRGSILIRLGQIAAAEHALLEAQAMYDRLDVARAPGQNSDPAFSLGLIALISGDYARAEALGDQVRRRSEANGHQLNLEVARYLLARAALEQGQIERAQHHAQLAHDIARRVDDQWFLAHCLTTLGDIAVAFEDLEAAKRYYVLAHEIRDAFNDLEGKALVLVALGSIAAAQKDYVEARRLCQRSQELYQRTGDKGGLANALNSLARAELGLGEPERAASHLLVALQLALEIQYVPLILEICLRAGHLYLHTADIQHGLDLLAFVWGHPGSPDSLRTQVEQIFSHDRADLAPAFLAARSRTVSPDELDDVTRQLLTDLSQPAGRPPQASREEVIEPLSSREQEVLALIALGLTNQEIAGRLNVSANTIKTHIQHIYGKLGVSNRIAAINRAQALHLL